MTKIVGLETRKKIYDIISKNPGVHALRIAEILQLSAQLVDYHLYYMQRDNLIVYEKESGYKRCYIKGEIGTEDKKMLSLLRQDIPLSIVFFLLKNPYSRHKDIFKSLNLSSARLSYHLKKLVKNGIVTESSSGEKNGYIVKDNKEIIRFLIRYKPTSITKKVKDTWEDFGPG